VVAGVGFTAHPTFDICIGESAVELPPYQQVVDAQSHERVFPSICEGRSPEDPVRIWVPGCASGEEVSSIAMALVCEIFQSVWVNPPSDG
jgi:hypothetical protein